MIQKDKVVLESLEDWKAKAGPKRPNQWRNYRSAKESARAWLDRKGGPGPPREITRVLEAHPHFGGIEDWHAEPECLIHFDEFGGPANVDVLLTGRDANGTFVVAVEAKADETFGPLLGQALSRALERRLRSASSRGLDRIENLSGAILGPAAKGDPPLRQIRYQLLTATAGAIARANDEGVKRAVLFVHEFATPLTEREKRARNSRDLVCFLKRLGAENPERVLDGALVGPITVPGGGAFENPPSLYVGKAVREVPERDT